MDALCADFEMATQLRFYNPTYFNLYIDPGDDGKGVYTDQFIPSNTCIGEIEGEPAYIWDIRHTRYLIVDDDFVLDVSKLNPKPVFAWLREDNESDSFANCIIQCQTNHETGENKFYLWSISPISQGQELVYMAISRC